MENFDAMINVVKRAQNGDMDAFEEIVYKYEKAVYNIAFRMTANQDDAKEISQEIFIKIYKNLDKFEGKSQFSTWIHAIAVNMTIDEIRKRKRHNNISIDDEVETNDGSFSVQYEDDSPKPDEILLADERSKLISNAMQKLNDEHRIIITLRDFRDLSYSEIAQVLDINEGTVKSRISRARLKLKNILMSMEQMSGYIRQSSRKEER